MADKATAMVGNNKNVRNERHRQRRGKMNKSIFIIDKMREREKKWDLWNKTSLAAIFTPLYAYKGVTGHHIRGMTKTMMNYIPPTTNQNTEFNTLVCDWSNARSFSLIKKIAVFFCRLSDHHYGKRPVFVSLSFYIGEMKWRDTETIKMGLEIKASSKCVMDAPVLNMYTVMI